VRKRLWIVVAAAAAAVVAMRKSVQEQRAERALWAEATDDVQDPAR
jgi:hypothetical protein